MGIRFLSFPREPVYLFFLFCREGLITKILVKFWPKRMENNVSVVVVFEVHVVVFRVHSKLRLCTAIQFHKKCILTKTSFLLTNQLVFTHSSNKQIPKMPIIPSSPNSLQTFMKRLKKVTYLVCKASRAST